MLCICSFLMLAGLASRGDAVPPGYVSGSEETGNDTPLAPARQGRLGTRVPRQRSKSPAELDFYGEFYAALCGAPALPVLPSAKVGRGLRPVGARKGTLLRAFFDLLFGNIWILWLKNGDGNWTGRVIFRGRIGGKRKNSENLP